MDPAQRQPDRIGELRVSARGWHTVQLAVLGFIGLCGVLQRDTGSGPHWLQVLAGVLVLVALGLACLATVLVALAAWPVYGARTSTADEDVELAGTSNRLRAGITLTYVAVAVLALGTSSTWWPGGSGSGAAVRTVQVATRAGELCGDVASPSRQGVMALSVGDRTVEVALADVVSVQPVDAC